VILEPTGTYGDVLRWHFEQAGAAVYRVDGKRVHDGREFYDGVPSLHDGKAAGIIAEIHRTGRSRRWRWHEDARRDQLACLKVLRNCQRRQQRALNQLEAALSRHWPELDELCSLERASVQALLAHYGEPRAVAADVDGAQVLLARVGGSLLTKEKREAIVASAVRSLGVPCRRSEREEIRWLAEELQAMRREIALQEKALGDLVEGHPAQAQMAPVIGKTSAAALYVTLGDPRDYAHARAWLKSAGLNLKQRQSGQYTGQLKLTKRGPGLARHFLYMAVLRWIQADPLARRWYEAKVARDGGLKMKALIALMRKLAKGLWAASRRGEAFDSTRLFGVSPRG
jgi:transposase